ncbi:MAG TPA: plastocyanin/azurin family copper-binding protein [Solirubrobacterales bacterium]|nr:plastocyanin/azurin family copper-binding protein [Solirubrobacterales bacterium]HNL61296.1 plastocyanin/azurin family copper-binding protein [Solirubrobacterales bacterium]
MLIAVFAAAVVASAFTAPASANNTRVTIADFHWSNKNPEVDLGESVLWTWTGPDTQHSVTGQPAGNSGAESGLPGIGTVATDDASQWDSDPDTNYPIHYPGSEYKVTFDHPGKYLFVCKVHASVRGVVTVSDTPGNPDSDFGPAPVINFDTEGPLIDTYFFTSNGTDPTMPFIGHKGKGIGFSFGTNEGGSASADYYRLVKRGKGKKARYVKFFQGYNEWPTHIGMNNVRFAARSSTFKPVPGKYVAYFRAEDGKSNSSDDITLNFTVFPKKKR